MKKTFLAFLFLFSLAAFFSAGFCTAENGLEIDYPKLQIFPDSSQITSVNTPLEKYLRYVFDFGIAISFFAAFISLIVSGVMYLLSPAIPSAKTMAKDRVTGTITGLLVLMLLYLIITTVNPNLAIFKSEKLEPVPVAEEKKPAGVYFYKQKGCAGDSELYNTSVRDLGEALTNKINSAKIVQGGQDESYISVLYQYPDFWGMCYYVDPNNAKCSNVPAFAVSASVHKYDFSAEGEGVKIYRKSFFDADGGYLNIANQKINGIYIGRLEKMFFTNDAGKCTVPEKEQVCANWDQNGNCIKKTCPNLAGENISSIEIKGNYIVMLVYYNPSEFGSSNPSNLWSWCQEFPADNDADQNGPEQIKWEGIRQTGKLPNSIVIIPVVK